MKFSTSVLFGGLALGAFASPQVVGQTFEQKCAALSSQLTEKVVGFQSIVQPAQFVKAGTTIHWNNTASGCLASQLVTVDLCRVSLNVTTSPRSGIRMEAWLPVNWTGRFLSTGNGGLGGCIQVSDMEYAASYGFATVGANNGHDGFSGASFIEPEVLRDFAYRSLHTGVVIGKTITKTFYGSAHKKSYYLGCSTGGRQGFKSIENYPADFDGVVAGAPAISFNNLTIWALHFYPLTGKNTSEQFVPQALWQTIATDVLAQCDTLDGVADGIIEDPDKCVYQPERLACRNGATTNCLRPAQVNLVRAVLSPVIDPTDGSLVYPRMQPGAERVASLVYWGGNVFGASDYWAYGIKKDPTWDPITANVNDWHQVEKANPFNISTWAGDLSPFANRGGKVLTYHGLMDSTITSDNTKRYYQHVSDTMKKSPAQLDDFFRYFRISGMDHCQGGSGASFIGNQRVSLASALPEENVLWAMVRWVEQGTAPDVIRGTAYVNGDKTQGVDYKRNHCRWPARTTYKGSGDPKLLDSWYCK